jgi:hypothetical protein
LPGGAAQQVAGQTRNSRPGQDGRIRQKFCAWRVCITPTIPRPDVTSGCWRGGALRALCKSCCPTTRPPRCRSGCLTPPIARRWFGSSRRC